MHGCSMLQILLQNCGRNLLFKRVCMNLTLTLPITLGRSYVPCTLRKDALSYFQSISIFIPFYILPFKKTQSITH